MPISMGVAAWKAAARSLASISETSLPMNTGMSVSTSATPSPVTNMAPKSHRACRTKCQ